MVNGVCATYGSGLSIITIMICYVYHVKVSSISKFILMYATVTCMNFYVCYCRDVHHIILYTMSKIIIIMSC